MYVTVVGMPTYDNTPIYGNMLRVNAAMDVILVGNWIEVRYGVCEKACSPIAVTEVGITIDRNEVFSNI